MKLHILATVLPKGDIRGTTLVFETLRVGFPDARVQVWGNQLAPEDEAIVRTACDAASCHFDQADWRPHDIHIERLIQHEPDPFVICDTDMIFFDNLEKRLKALDRAILFAGEYQPEFLERWTGTVHVARLHTCVMWINPVPLRQEIRRWQATFPLPWGSTGIMPLVRQTFLPRYGSLPLFYDTCAGLWQAVGADGGHALSEADLMTFEHLNCGTYAHLIDTIPNLRQVHDAIYRDRTLAMGLRAQQARYYDQHAVDNAA